MQLSGSATLLLQHSKATSSNFGPKPAIIADEFHSLHNLPRQIPGWNIGVGRYRFLLNPFEAITLYLHWSTKILSHEEECLSDVFLDAEFKYVFRIYLSPTPIALHQTM